MADYREAFVGIDVTKLKNAIAVTESDQDGVDLPFKSGVSVLIKPLFWSSYASV